MVGGGGDQMNGWRPSTDGGSEGRPESAAKVPKIPTVGSEIAGRGRGRGRRAGGIEGERAGRQVGG